MDTVSSDSACILIFCCYHFLLYVDRCAGFSSSQSYGNILHRGWLIFDDWMYLDFQKEV